ncbi:MAG: (Fe-S)-binding protein [Hyphomicrobiales bacterium]|nr:(Fe-S)-binding protein [Hyphomicrobiales bacterium]MDE2016159.1 (Fe-S)-binding protein [Hyphomicrobiales bacterium]
MSAEPRVPDAAKPPKVGLFVTCLVDLFRPSVGFAAVRLIEESGCEVVVPRQTCCGQPAYNSGDRKDAKAIARATIEAFAGCDHVVAPSGSCAGTLRAHYPELFADEPDFLPKARAFAARCHELTSFLVDVRGMERVAAEGVGAVAYHDSCSGLRELGVRAQPRKLLAAMQGTTLVELADPDACCGFGGTFAVKYPEISDAIVGRKADDVAATGAPLLLAGDLGCLMNMAGKLQRQGKPVVARHVAEVLAGMTETPPIGAPSPQTSPHEAPSEAKP